MPEGTAGTLNPPGQPLSTGGLGTTGNEPQGVIATTVGAPSYSHAAAYNHVPPFRPSAALQWTAPAPAPAHYFGPLAAPQPGAWGYGMSDNDMRIVIMNNENERLRREQEIMLARERSAAERERVAAETSRIKFMTAKAKMAAALEAFVSAPPSNPPGHSFYGRF